MTSTIIRSPYPDVTIPDISLPAFVFADAAKHAAKPALIDGPSGRAITYRELVGGARLAAGGLAARGFQQGEVFAIYCPNLPEYAVAFYGVLLAGGTNTTINPLYTVEELSAQLNDAGASYLLTVPRSWTRPSRRPADQVSGRSSCSARPPAPPRSRRCCGPAGSPPG
jgi:acyl-CoA synthetase (AMP-forming)/AMP-acid ligase II